MTNEEIVKEKRFRFAVQKGEYSRAITLFLQIKYPGMSFADLERLPYSEIKNAQVCVDNAFIARWNQKKEKL